MLSDTQPGFGDDPRLAHPVLRRSPLQPANLVAVASHILGVGARRGGPPAVPVEFGEPARVERPRAAGPGQRPAARQPAAGDEQRHLQQLQPVRHVRAQEELHASALCRYASRPAASTATARTVIHTLPTSCPGRNASDPNASHRNSTESTASPAAFDAMTAINHRRRRSGSYTPQSANSDKPNAAADANASRGEATSADSAAPAVIAASTAHRPAASCSRSRSVNANPAK